VTLTADQKRTAERAGTFLAAASEDADALAGHLQTGPVEDAAQFYATHAFGAARHHIAELLGIIAAPSAVSSRQAGTVPACGPFETEWQARETPAARAIYAAFASSPGAGRIAPHNRNLLDAACRAAGVDVGAYDDVILGWLSYYEPATCVVIAGLIRRAHAAARADLTARLIPLRDHLAEVLDDGDRDRQYALERAERELTAITQDVPPATGEAAQR
jgi:hypothetical protein